jgi:ATP-dependent exoDNAse (exonuclease V) alpha subunit
MRFYSRAEQSTAQIENTLSSRRKPQSTLQKAALVTAGRSTMPRAPSTFRQTDVTRAVRAVVAAGVEIMRVEIDKAGKIVIVAATAPADSPLGELDRELTAFEARHDKD